MRANGRIARYATLTFIISCIVVSCEDKDPLKPYWTYYHIYADSIEVQAELMQTEMLDITFYYALSSTCYQFHSFETSIDADTLSVKMVGKHQHNVACGASIEYEQKVLPIIGFTVGMWYIRVLQPIGEDLIDSVLVLR